jgi:hypothetical protein
MIAHFEVFACFWAMPDGVPSHLLTRIEATCFFYFLF